MAGEKPRACPICGKPQNPEFRPFCSARCVDIDLGRWLGGNYRIATEEEPESGIPKEDEEKQ
jgi:endogenous inhibitor of DNA gyrase (YacG/DUF329 family)